MKNMTLRNMTDACGGTFSGSRADLDREISSVTADSRSAEPGCLFAAIMGSRADGNDFIPEVEEKGALCVLTERDPDSLNIKRDSTKREYSGNFIKVNSVIESLGSLAGYYREQLSIPVVGITGSVGKTSTKEMIAAVLSQRFRTLKTEGNFNNELGLPLTIFRAGENDQIAVLEMGISHFGEMHHLAEIAKPDTCIITNIGDCHLEFLQDRDGVLKAKSEMFDFLRPDGHVILNGDDEKLKTIREVKGIRPVFFGMDRDNDIYADHIEKKGLDGISCDIHTADVCFHVQVPVPGIHMVMNALAAAAAGIYYGLTPDEIRAGIESFKPVGGRLHVIHTEDYTIIDDCYNANPMSMKASLEILQEAGNTDSDVMNGKRKVAILGDMAELGEDEEQIHRSLGEFAGGLDIDMCICAGRLGRFITEGIRAVNDEMETVYLPDMQELLAKVPSLLCRGDTILVKASHFMNFDKIVDRLSGKI